MLILYQDGMSYLDLIYGVTQTPEWMIEITDGEVQMKEVKDLQKYWNEKYPNVHTILWSNQEGDRYYGKMMAHNKTGELSASTIGELISQGEAFLRKVN